MNVSKLIKTAMATIAIASSAQAIAKNAPTSGSSAGTEYNGCNSKNSCNGEKEHATTTDSAEGEEAAVEDEAAAPENDLEVETSPDDE